MHASKPIGHRPVGGAGGADAEQCVDGEIEAPGRRLGEVHPGVACALQRRLRVGGQPGFVADAGDDRRKAALAELRRGFEAVAAVVARSAGDPDRARLGRHGHGQPGHGESRALHQRVRRQQRGGRLLDAACRGNVEQVGDGRGVDALHGTGLRR